MIAALSESQRSAIDSAGRFAMAIHLTALREITMEINDIFLNHSKGGNNYVLKADSKNRWTGFNKKTIEQLIDKFGSAFNIVLWGSKSESDFYCIPFSALEHLFTKEHMTKGTLAEQGNHRWTATVTDHVFKMHANSMYAVRIERFYGKQKPGVIETYSDLDEAFGIDYTIEDAKANVKIRLGQSEFRRAVLDNFSGKCCISGISEPTLLVASHIVPWSADKNIRSDPGNGLLLFVEYDAYFDKGFISIDEELRIVVTNRLLELSADLQFRLKKIAGTTIEQPSKHKIKNQYIAYHAEHVLIK